MKKIVFLFLFSLLFISFPSFADINSTREILRQHCQNNPNVLETYNQAATSWSEYANHADADWELERLLKAVEYAAEKHNGQVRKDAESTPYIIHPIGVARLLWEVGNIRSINILTSALLHDTLEDTDATEQEIETLFGTRVLYTVKEVSNESGLSTQKNKERQIEHAPTMSLDGQLVKLADRLYNIRDLNNPPPSWSDEKVSEYYGWGEKLLKRLKGTNEGLETALKKLISFHKGTKNDSNQSLEKKQFVIPLLTKQEIINGYYEGLKAGATHMLIVHDTFDYEDSYDFIVYCHVEENLTDLINHYTAPGYYRVSAVYNMALDIEEQI